MYLTYVKEKLQLSCYPRQKERNFLRGRSYLCQESAWICW